jgi:hypothetical protein
MFQTEAVDLSKIIFYVMNTYIFVTMSRFLDTVEILILVM